MQFNKKYLEKLGVAIELTAFAPEKKTGEWHAIMHVEPRGESFQEQFRRISEAARLGFSRIFVSAFSSLEQKAPEGIQVIKVADVPALVKRLFK